MSIFTIASWLTPTSLFLFINIMVGTIFLISRLSPPKTPDPHQQFGHDDDGYYYSAPPPLQRAPSLLDRVKSINLSSYKFTNQQDNLAAAHHPLERAPSILERVKSFNFSLYKSFPQKPSSDSIHPTEQLSRSPSILERVKSFDFTSCYRSDSVKLNQNQQTETPEEVDDDSDTDHMSSPTVDGEIKRSKSGHSNVIQRKLSEKMKKSASESWTRKSEIQAEDEKEEEEEEEENDEVESRRPATTRLEKTGGDKDVDAKADDFISKFKHQLKLQRLDSLLRYRDMLKGK